MEHYQVERTIGKGSFGKVYLVCDKREQSSCCLKVVNLQKIPGKERESCKTEIELMHGLVHPNIVTFKESFVHKEGKFLCIVMAFCDGGDLAERLERNKGKLFEETQVLSWFVQILLGLHYMHSNKVLHRDLKTQNIFLLGNGRLVLGDFGISKKLSGDKDFAQTQIGTPYYMSPEQFRSKPYSFKSDVWSLGCVLYEMTTLRHPFDAASMNELTRKILAGRYAAISSRYSRNLKLLVKQLLCSTPRSRPSLYEIAQTSFIKRNIYEFLKDMIDRPNVAVGPGTMLFRNAITGEASQPATANLQKQLTSLGMKYMLQRVSHPITVDTSCADENARDNSAAKLEPFKERKKRKSLLKCRRKAIRQNNALIRAEERKRAVENALAKLENERELRIKARQDRDREREKRRVADRQRATKLAQMKQKTLEDRRKAVQLRAKQNKVVAPPNQDQNTKVASLCSETCMKTDSEGDKATPSTKERVLAEKQHRQRQQDEVLKEALCKAREERIRELHDAANKRVQQFAASPENEIFLRTEHDETKSHVLNEETNYEGMAEGEDQFSFSDVEQRGEHTDLEVKKASLQKELDIAKTICQTLMATLPKAAEGEPIVSEEDECTTASNSESEVESDSEVEPVTDSSFEPFTVQGWLAERTKLLRAECLNALGEELFLKVHVLLRESLENKLSSNHSVEGEARIRAQVKDLLVGKQEYVSKVDNLIFMQQTL